MNIFSKSYVLGLLSILLTIVLMFSFRETSEYVTYGAWSLIFLISLRVYQTLPGKS